MTNEQILELVKLYLKSGGDIEETSISFEISKRRLHANLHTAIERCLIDSKDSLEIFNITMSKCTNKEKTLNSFERSFAIRDENKKKIKSKIIFIKSFVNSQTPEQRYESLERIKELESQII